MRRVRYSVAMSLDGFIAGPNGESDWIVMDPEIDFGSLMGEFDTILPGRKTWEASQGQGSGMMPGFEAFVFSQTFKPSDCKDAVVSDDPAKTLSAIKGKPGNGRPLLPSPSGTSQRTGLKLVNQRIYPSTGTVSPEYSVIR
jgi:dihydrofolate reductase